MIMDFFKGTQKQIAPCISSKAKYALNLKFTQPNNIKKCSKKYWIDVIESLCIKHKVIDQSLNKSAIEKYDELILNNYVKNK
jgi:hypothetical protein